MKYPTIPNTKLDTLPNMGLRDEGASALDPLSSNPYLTL